MDADYSEFIRLHEPQLKNSGVKELFWPALFHKLKHDVWDLVDRVALNRVILVDAETDQEENHGAPSSPRVYLKDELLRPEDPQNIFLVDHAWTFELPSARAMLLAYPNLLTRMCDIVDLAANAGESVEEVVGDILREMWKYTNTYTVNSASLEIEQKLPRWYIMDEIGARVRHSDSPKCRIVPFYYISQQITYSLMFPICTISPGEELTRNHVENMLLADPLTRQCKLLPWLESDLPPFVEFEPREVGSDYFSNSKLKDSLPAEVSISGADVLKKNGCLNVFSEYSVVEDFLRDSRFKLVDNQADADILWYSRHFYDFKALCEEFPDKFVNQFPFESVITVKDLLAVVCRRAVPVGSKLIDPVTLESQPVWLPTTYNLDLDLPNFVKYFQAREEKELDNLWICKPWNLARSLDITISDELSCLLRLPETGPKLCSKYIEDPVLFLRDDVPDGPVKFDLRFIAILKSVKPLKVAIYRRFWLRFANKPFALDDFDVYDKHFTVMNYGQGPIHQMFCHKFVEKFEQQNAGCDWKVVEKDLYAVVKQVFEAATVRPAPEGIAHSSQSRAVYGLDFMLKWKNTNGKRTAQPMLLEINYSPDCKRACDYYPDFYDELFSYMFLDESKDSIAEL